jgi:hypothetical protein
VLDAVYRAPLRVWYGLAQIHRQREFSPCLGCMRLWTTSLDSAFASENDRAQRIWSNVQVGSPGRQDLSFQQKIPRSVVHKCGASIVQPSWTLQGLSWVVRCSSIAKSHRLAIPIKSRHEADSSAIHRPARTVRLCAQQTGRTGDHSMGPDADAWKSRSCQNDEHTARIRLSCWTPCAIYVTRGAG